MLIAGCMSNTVPAGNRDDVMLAMVLASLAAGESHIAGVAADAAVTRLGECLAALGATVAQDPAGTWHITGRGIGGLAEPSTVLDVGDSATAAALLAATLAGHEMFSVVAGDADVAALRELLAATGARLTARAGGRLPLVVEGTATPLPLAGHLPVGAPVAAALLAGLGARGDSILTFERVAETTLSLLRGFGARVDVTAEPGGRIITLTGQPELHPADVTFTRPPIVAIDGPAAAGKGTLARRIAAALGVPYLDTGLLYRAVGRRVLDAGGEPGEPATAEAAARALQPADLQRSDLRGPQADAAAAAVAAIPAVRAALLAFQRGFARDDGGVLDGRDIGTVIFPDATLKLFVTASPESARASPVAGAAGARRTGHARRGRHRHAGA